MRVAAMQMALSPGDPARNLRMATRWVEAAAGEGADLVVLPELLASGYRFDDDLAESAQRGPTVTALSELAADHGLTVVAGVLERGAPRGMLHDTAVVVSPTGLVGAVRKARLWGSEHGVFAKGPVERPIVEVAGVRLGVLICVEVVYPEIARQLARDGADLLVVVSAFGAPRAPIFDLMTRARAAENGCFLAVANLCGDDGHHAFCGLSRVVGPRGDVRVDAGDEVGVAMVDIDLADIEQTRAELPYLRESFSQA